ncbi:VWA domain-containing protein [Actinotalea solisilvae]|uniref:VWA domain-containing protein n=1 Tax=Actinotalea solisilvae TaxID=2072922 RepID=UPI0018F1E27E|nr:VWA domain-containing protein [Actinotalea solisilvae]
MTAAVALLLGALLAPGAAAVEDPEITPDPFGYFTPVLVLLDTSGSMEDLVGGSDARRIDAARGAVLDLITALGTGQQFGLMRYPDTAAGTGAHDCEHATSTVKLGPLDVSAAAAAVRTLEPDGGTPTGPAIAQAAELLRTTYGGRAGGVVVVVSDGEANCGTPPCDVARQVRDSGLEVQFNTIGLNLSDDEAEELRCVAEVGEGTYVDVADGGDPTQAIARAARAALALDVQLPQSFDVVAGTGDGGTHVSVEVSSTGRTRAANVRVSLAVTRSNVGDVTVAHPVRFLGNIAPGDSRTVSFTVRPDDEGGDGPVAVSVSALAGNAAPAVWTGSSELTDTLDASRLGGVLADIERVVVLGDSYSSGEGAGSYRPGSDGGDGSSCHRSDHTYAAALWGRESTEIIACSGAVTGNLTGPQPPPSFLGVRTGGATMPPQLLELRDLALSDTPPGAVLVSIGGNDAGFGGFARACVVQIRCDADLVRARPNAAGQMITPLTDMLNRAMGVQDDVTVALGAVDAAVNDTVAMDHRDGRAIPVVVMPYPRIIPPTREDVQAPAGCSSGIGPEEVRVLNQFIDALNTSVTLAALSWHGQGRPVYVATDVADAFLPDHTICDGTSSYANKVDLRDPLNPEQLHPNTDGYRAMARALVAWSNGTGARPVTLQNDPTWNPHVVRRAVTTIESTLQTPLVTREIGTQALGPVYVPAEGFAPGSGVVIRLDSRPRTLTVATADEHGRVAAWTRVPADTTVGMHHIVVLGQDADGYPISTSTPVGVLPQGGSGLFGLLTLGLTLLAAGALLLLRTRRPTRRPRS